MSIKMGFILPADSLLRLGCLELTEQSPWYATICYKYQNLDIVLSVLIQQPQHINDGQTQTVL